VAGTGSIDHGDVKGGCVRYIGKELAGGGRSFLCLLFAPCIACHGGFVLYLFASLLVIVCKYGNDTYLHFHKVDPKQTYNLFIESSEGL
jgi:hypothetical protein